MNPALPLTCSRLCIALLAICTSGAWGQLDQTTEEKKGPSLRMTLMPVGDSPAAGVIYEKNLPVLVMPKPSELIPASVFVKDKDGYKTIRLTMNSPSKPVSLPGGIDTELLIQSDSGYSGYMKFQLPPEKEDVTVFMLRNQQSKDWQAAPHAIVFKNGLETFPFGSVRLINFSSAPLQATIGSIEAEVAPKSFKVFTNPGKLGENVGFPYEVVAEIDQKERRITKTAVSYDTKTRMNLIVYDRDGKSEVQIEGSDQPVKIVKYFELPYSAPAPDPAEP